MSISACPLPSSDTTGTAMLWEPSTGPLSLQRSVCAPDGNILPLPVTGLSDAVVADFPVLPSPQVLSGGSKTVDQLAVDAAISDQTLREWHPPARCLPELRGELLPGKENLYLLRVTGVQVAPPPGTPTPPVNLTICIDTSASMSDGTVPGGLNKLTEAVLAVIFIAQRLLPCDTLAVVTFNTMPSLLFPACKMLPAARGELMMALRGLVASGGTAILRTVLTVKELVPATSSIILLTDGLDDSCRMCGEGRLAGTAPCYCVAIGTGADFEYCRGIAATTKGDTVSVASSEDIVRVMGGILIASTTPRVPVVSIKVQTAEEEAPVEVLTGGEAQTVTFREINQSDVRVAVIRSASVSGVTALCEQFKVACVGGGEGDVTQAEKTYVTIQEALLEKQAGDVLRSVVDDAVPVDQALTSLDTLMGSRLYRSVSVGMGTMEEVSRIRSGLKSGDRREVQQLTRQVSEALLQQHTLSSLSGLRRHRAETIDTAQQLAGEARKRMRTT